MKALLLATTLACFTVGTASAAPTYPWCQRTKMTGGTPDCSFTSRGQCRASVSGVGGDCIRNPSLAYGDQRGLDGRRNMHRGW
jgi:hypothetical protein